MTLTFGQTSFRLISSIDDTTYNSSTKFWEVSVLQKKVINYYILSQKCALLKPKYFENPSFNICHTKDLIASGH